MTTEKSLQSRLEDSVKQFHVPGAALAVVQDDRTEIAVAGLANAATGLPVTDDTLFATGSVCKVFTAALLMSLVDDGLLDLDQPLQHYLPDFRMADPEWSRRVTVRMLLCHSSAIPGNFTAEVPRGPDILKHYTAALANSAFDAEPGRYWSYSNAGITLAGRVAEVVTGLSYDEALDRRILQPLNANATTDPERMLLRRIAVGHLVNPGTGEARLPPEFRFTPLHGPAGTTLWGDIHCFADFARMHLDGLNGAPSGPLSAAAIRQMATPQIGQPWGSPLDHFGLGWGLLDTPDGPVLFHSGANIGSHSVLWVIPHRNAAVALMTNGTTGMALQPTLVAELLQERFGIPASQALQPPERPAELALDAYAGTYVADQGQARVELANGQLQLAMEYDDFLRHEFDMMGVPYSTESMRLIPVDAERFVAEAAPGAYMPVSFKTAEQGDGPTHVYVGRIFQRAS